MNPGHLIPEGEVLVEVILATEVEKEDGELGMVDLAMEHPQETDISCYVIAATPKDTDRKNVQQKRN